MKRHAPRSSCNWSIRRSRRATCREAIRLKTHRKLQPNGEFSGAHSGSARTIIPSHQSDRAVAAFRRRCRCQSRSAGHTRALLLASAPTRSDARKETPTRKRICSPRSTSCRRKSSRHTRAPETRRGEEIWSSYFSRFGRGVSDLIRQLLDKGRRKSLRLRENGTRIRAAISDFGNRVRRISTATTKDARLHSAIAARRHTVIEYSFLGDQPSPGSFRGIFFQAVPPGDARPIARAPCLGTARRAAERPQPTDFEAQSYVLYDALIVEPMAEIREDAETSGDRARRPNARPALCRAPQLHYAPLPHPGRHRSRSPAARIFISSR